MVSIGNVIVGGESIYGVFNVFFGKLIYFYIYMNIEINYFNFYGVKFLNYLVIFYIYLISDIFVFFIFKEIKVLFILKMLSIIYS